MHVACGDTLQEHPVQVRVSVIDAATTCLFIPFGHATSPDATMHAWSPDAWQTSAHDEGVALPVQSRDFPELALGNVARFETQVGGVAGTKRTEFTAPGFPTTPVWHPPFGTKLPSCPPQPAVS